jgi:small-conductance mechanosensitive channel
MAAPFALVGPDHALSIFGIRLVGFDSVTLRKVAITIAFLVAVTLIASVLRAVARFATRGDARRHARFLWQQVVSLLATVLSVIVLISIWFDNPSRFASAAALITAGLAVALQKLVMSFVGYLAILRGNTFKVGDRITMGGVRGDVVALGYIRTSIMEMGQPPSVQSADPAMWVEARQYTGRIVSTRFSIRRSTTSRAISLTFLKRCTYPFLTTRIMRLRSASSSMRLGGTRCRSPRWGGRTSIGWRSATSCGRSMKQSNRTFITA